ncbi:hypothetical protein ACQP2T_15865 [Nonomuraea sp. CA-143628]|uniref:hypothetical protein n=1 Tax=Nonomuraea sp. CA-143628 TaxID=3239997 RepID=UPI003D92F498
MVLLQATAVSPALRLALAQRYGVSSVAIWLRPNASLPDKQANNRQDDSGTWINAGSST